MDKSIRSGCPSNNDATKLELRGKKRSGEIYKDVIGKHIRRNVSPFSVSTDEPKRASVCSLNVLLTRNRFALEDSSEIVSSERDRSTCFGFPRKASKDIDQRRQSRQENVTSLISSSALLLA